MRALALAAALAVCAMAALLPWRLSASLPPPLQASVPLLDPTAAPPPLPPADLPDPPDPPEDPPVRAVTPGKSPTTVPLARIAEAEAAKLSVVKGLFAAAHVTFPPAQMLLRAFKKEKRVELWAASRAGGAMAHVTTYEICRASGELGPKRQEGDWQVPEGFYTLGDYTPATGYYLAMLVSYPNLSDRILGDKQHPGNEIMIHGRCASVGCLAMSDERIQEIWVAAAALRNAGGVVHLHIFPSRDMAGLVRNAPDDATRAFWANLAEGLDFFAAQRRQPVVRVDAEGRYHFH
jgi:hypothetical protein